MSERWNTVKELFQAASQLPPDDRASFLEDGCGADHGLRTEIESLLEAEERSLPWIDGHVFEATAGLWASRLDRLEGLRIGPYRLVRELGRGGMGAVYLALRADEQFQQQVAIKLIQRGLDSGEIVDRFRRERQILASLAHPNIARLLDGGVTEEGLPYLVMEYIEGEPIDQYCAHRKLTVAQRLELFLTVCAAVHHAHRSLVVHRDIKPGNVLVTTDGVPKLLDFGIAKLLGSNHVPFHTEVTGAGPVPLTLDYASPEQVRGQPITTASDVYSLGVLLYELLTGALPHDLAGRERRDIEQLICEVEPARPSTVVSATLAEPTGKPLAAPLVKRARRILRRQLAGDVDNIVAMALRKEPQRRYGSAAQFAEDLRRHLAGQPVTACPDTFPYLAAKFVRRHRLGTLAVVLIALSLVAGMLTTSWQAREARAQRRRASIEAAAAEQVAHFLTSLLQQADPFGKTGEEVSVRELLDRATERIGEELVDQPIVRARMLDTLGVAYSNLGHYDQARPVLEQAMEIRNRVLGAQAPETAESLSHLGMLLRLTGQLAEAEELLRQALASRTVHFGGESVQVAETLGELASVLRERGEYAEAEPMARKALALRQTLLGADAIEVAESLNDLALLLKKTGGYAPAEKLYRRARALYRSQLGENSLELAITDHNLADLLLRRGRWEEAIVSMRQGLAIYRHQLGDNNTYVAGGLNTLGVLLKQTEQFSEAEEAYREALTLRTSLLGPDHPSVARAASNLGAVLIESGDLKAAETLILQALESLRRGLGENHPGIVPSLLHLGQLRLKQGKPAEAEMLYRQALQLARETLGEDHPRVATANLGVGRALLLNANPKGAEGYLREGLRIYQARLGDEHWLVAEAKSWLGGCLASQHRYREAEPLLIEGHRGLVARRGDRHSATRAAAERLQALYLALGRAG